MTNRIAALFGHGRHWGPALGVVAGALVLAFASPAQAKDEFEHAFKYELGRIAAHEAVYAGKHLLGAIVFGYPAPSHGAAPYYGQGAYPPRDYGYGHRKSRHHGPPYGKAYGYRAKHVHHHYYHGSPCGHAEHVGYPDGHGYQRTHYGH